MGRAARTKSHRLKAAARCRVSFDRLQHFHKGGPGAITAHEVLDINLCLR